MGLHTPNVCPKTSALICIICIMLKAGWTFAWSAGLPGYSTMIETTTTNREISGIHSLGTPPFLACVS